MPEYEVPLMATRCWLSLSQSLHLTRQLICFLLLESIHLNFSVSSVFSLSDRPTKNKSCPFALWPLFAVNNFCRHHLRWGCVCLSHSLSCTFQLHLVLKTGDVLYISQLSRYFYFLFYFYVKKINWNLSATLRPSCKLVTLLILTVTDSKWF